MESISYRFRDKMAIYVKLSSRVFNALLIGFLLKFLNGIGARKKTRMPTPTGLSKSATIIHLHSFRYNTCIGQTETVFYCTSWTCDDNSASIDGANTIISSAYRKTFTHADRTKQPQFERRSLFINLIRLYAVCLLRVQACDQNTLTSCSECCGKL